MATRHNLNHRRSTVFYGLLGMLCLARTLETAPLTDNNEPTGTLLSGLMTKNAVEKKVGSPTENAFKAWLLLIDGNADNLPMDTSDSSSLLRRIKPKSIFVAPNRTACADGYQDDTMNRCVKDVNIDHQAQKVFLVQRLKNLFGSKSHAAGSSSSSSSSSVPSGPFQLNLPLTMSAPDKPARHKFDFHVRNPENPTSSTDSSKVVTVESSTEADVPDEPRDALVTVYELNENESKFFLGNESSKISTNDDKSSSTKSDILLPVAEFIDVADKKISGVVDYEIPIVVDATGNMTTIVDDSTIGDDLETAYEETPVGIVSDDEKSNIAPTLVLLLSPTKAPTIFVASDDLAVAKDSSRVKTENATSDATEDIVGTSATDSVVLSSTTEKDSTMDTTSVTDFTSGDDYSTETTDTTESYDEDNYEESTENEDEILKHSEAGMTVTLPSAVTTAGERLTSIPTAVHDDKPPTGNSKISSEVSINRDFVRETTLVDFNNLNEPPNSTSFPTTDDSTSVLGIEKNPEPVTPNDEISVDDSTNVKSIDYNENFSENRSNDSHVNKLSPHDTSASDDDAKQETSIVAFPTESMNVEVDTTIRDSTTPTEKINESSETMIASSTNVAGTFVARDDPEIDVISSSSNDKRASVPFTFETTTTRVSRKPFTTVSNIYDYEPRDYYPRRNPYGSSGDDGIPIIRTIDEQRYRPDSGDVDRDFLDAQQQRQQQQQQDYVRFPNSDRHGPPSYVRFPSEEANSIHPNDYKDRRPYNRFAQQQNYGRGLISTRSSSDPVNNRKQPYWWLPPGWRTDNRNDPSQNAQHRSRSANDRSRTPMLLGFWTTMPLMKDPSGNYQQTTHTTPETRNYESPRRANYYKELSADDFNRALAEKSLPRAVGG